MRKVVYCLLVATLLVIPILAECTPKEEKSVGLPEVVTINTLPRGLYYVLGAGIARMIEKYTPMKAFVEPTPNAPASVPLFRQGKMEFQMNSVPSVYREIRGLIDFQKVGKLSMRAVALGVENMFVVVTRSDSDINSIKDLAGKKVMFKTAASHNASEVSRLAMEYYGVADKVVSIPAPHVSQRAEYLKTRAVDAFWSPLVAGVLQEVDSSVGLRLIGVSKEAAEYVRSKFSGGLSVVIRKGYLGVFKKDTRAVGFTSGLCCITTLADETVYTVLKAMYDHYDEMAKIHPQLKKMSLNRAARRNFIVPYHPGAVKFFKDRGVWSEQHDKVQKRLLDELQKIEK